MFFRDIERVKRYDAIIKDFPCDKIEELVSKSKSHLLKVSRGEIPGCWRDIIYKKGACEKFLNKTRECMKNFDKFGGFTNNQIENYIFMLRTVTEDLDYALEVLLPEVIFFIVKDLFRISSEETKQYMLMTEELYCLNCIKYCLWQKNCINISRQRLVELKFFLFS